MRLPVNVFDVFAHGAVRTKQPIGNFLIGMTLHQLFKQFGFANGELRKGLRAMLAAEKAAGDYEIVWKGRQ